MPCRAVRSREFGVENPWIELYLQFEVSISIIRLLKLAGGVTQAGVGAIPDELEGKESHS